MALDAGVVRTGAAALIPEDASREIVKGVPMSSVAMRLMRRLPNMPTKQRRMPVLSALPTAYFVNGDTGQKKTTQAAWANKYLDAEELAVIVPIPEQVLDDVDYDIWGEIKPLLVEAFGIAIDQAVFWGDNAPTAWPLNILAGCWKAQNLVTLGTGVDIADDVGDENGVMATVEADGYEVSGFAADIAVKSKLRGLRGSDGQFIYQPSMRDGQPASLYGEPIEYVKTGMWKNTAATGPEVAGEEGGAWMIAGDFKQAVYAMRQDITYKILTEAVIQDDDDSILYNLAQQDMVALRAVLRLAWQIPNPINRLKPNAWASGAAGDFRYPFGALTRPAA